MSLSLSLGGELILTDDRLVNPFFIAVDDILELKGVDGNGIVYDLDGPVSGGKYRAARESNFELKNLARIGSHEIRGGDRGVVVGIFSSIFFTSNVVPVDMSVVEGRLTSNIQDDKYVARLKKDGISFFIQVSGGGSRHTDSDIMKELSDRSVFATGSSSASRALLIILLSLIIILLCYIIIRKL